MQIKYFCPRWGSEQIPWNEFLEKVKAAGYDGVEYGIPSDEPRENLEEVFNKSAARGLLLIAQHYDTYTGNFELHKTRFANWFGKIKGLRPFKINTQTGKDYFTLEQNGEMIGIAENFSEANGIDIVHETHRNKFSFAAHITKEYLKALPFLRLTFDVSHWVNVSESYLEDQEEAVLLAINRSDHIHTRVGYPEGPQVPDPRAPEWQDAVNRHIVWWDQIVEKRKTEAPGSVLTITPEFGPFPYMVHLPFVNHPISGQWEINEYMLELLKKRYASE
jgi:sugar phosphate isomerase/epimerase